MPILSFRPLSLDIRYVPVGTAAPVRITITGDGAPQPGDTYEAVVYKGNTLIEATVTVDDNVVNCLWSASQTTTMGCGTHKWRLTRIRSSLPQDLCTGKFEVKPRV